MSAAAPAISSAMAKATSSGPCGRLESMSDIENVVIATPRRRSDPRADVATVEIGRELRTGSASADGQEVVVGTALMLIGANSRTVSVAVDAKMQAIKRTLPPGIQVDTVLNRTLLVDATIRTVTVNLAEGALLVVLILFLLLGNFRAALITALVIPFSMLLTATGMLQGRISANLMSLGALDFGLIVDGAVIIVENACVGSQSASGELGRTLHAGGAACYGHIRRQGNDQADRLWPGHHHPRLRAAAHVQRRRRQDVRADGAHRHHCAHGGIRSVADLRPGADRNHDHRSASRKGRTSSVRALKRIYAPALGVSVRSPIGVVAVAVVTFSVAASCTRCGLDRSSSRRSTRRTWLCTPSAFRARH